ncbi:up-regulated during skeletal muscle growth protein 5-like isoform X2 [Gouania willdenowi]|uniref:up-regulated during skeletal muscle growth protein 5-like isoform X2 n=1 Tax=Gouania willdenowi TaxID=441366 RepID=UPI001055A1DE|nr:up-regulated during skeletal muscle growth protein 5-like isoform X2 [Gouania willdenowi]
MPTSPVKTRVPPMRFSHLVSEGTKQLFGIRAPSPEELTGWRKHFNSYTLQGRRNCVLATYGMLAVMGVAYLMHRRNKTENQASTAMD